MSGATSNGQGGGQGRRTALLVGIGLVALAGAVFGQVIHHDFLVYDDNWYVTENPHVRQGLTLEGIGWAFSALTNFWNPLTRLSHMIDVDLFGLNPAGHHGVNLALHALNVLLLFGFLRSATGSLWRSALVAALFAVHPLNVETVAWITERKGLLSAFFFFAALIAYARFARRPSFVSYGAVLLLFLLSLAAKPMAVTFPFLLLLLDAWPLGRLHTGGGKKPPRQGLGRLVLEKAPFFVLSGVFCLLTILAENEVSSIQSLETLPMGLRISNALVAYVTYALKTLWPVGLAVFYPYPETIPAWQVVGAAGILVAAGLAAWRLRDRFPYLGVGGLWYMGCLFPVIGLVAVTTSAMGDRYAYLSLIGPFMAMVWFAGDGARALERPGRVLAAACGALAVALLSVLSWQQTGHWKDSGTLFRHTIRVTRPNPVAHYNLGLWLDSRGSHRVAVDHFRKALEADPHLHAARKNLGVSLAKSGDLKGAEKAFREGLRIREGDAELWGNLGLTLMAGGRLEEALSSLERAVALHPEDARVHFNLGLALSKMGRVQEAKKLYRSALARDPGYARAHNNLGVLLLREGRAEEAGHHFRQALRLDPGCLPARKNLERMTGGSP